jgi:hypothetical protein
MNTFFIVCEDCKTGFFVGPKGHQRLRCDPCRYNNTLLRKRAVQARYREKKRRGKPPRRRTYYLYEEIIFLHGFRLGYKDIMEKLDIKSDYTYREHIRNINKNRGLNLELPII